jgi:hypothetical protein
MGLGEEALDSHRKDNGCLGHSGEEKMFFEHV